MPSSSHVSIFMEENLLDLLCIIGEIMNYVLLLVQFIQTDNFLNHKFIDYGYKAIEYMYMSYEERKNAVYVCNVQGKYLNLLRL